MPTYRIDEFSRKAMLGMTYSQRIEWFIWASKAQACTACQAEPFSPCINLAERKKGNERPTRWPHEPRVDWNRMLEGLRKRGYIDE